MIRIASTFCGLLLFTACDSSRAGPSATFTDSSGVQIVENDLRQEEALPRCEIVPEPRLRVGLAEGPPEFEFGDIASIASLSNGGVAVVDRQAKEIRVFDRSGAFVRRLGRRGEGPGEFGDPIEVVALNADTLAVWDWGLERIVTFDSAGGLVATVSIRPPLGNPKAWFVATESGRPYWLATTIANVPAGAGLIPRQLRLLAVARDGGARDTIGEYRERLVGWVNAQTRQTGSPLHDNTTSVAGRGTFVAIGSGDQPQFEIRDTSWRLLRVVRWTEGSRAVTPEANEEYRNRFLASLPSDADRAAWRPTLTSMPSADSFPTLAALYPSDDGTHWIRRYQRTPGDSTMLWRFDSTGVFQCALRLPSAMRVRAISATSLLIAASDSVGAPHVLAIDVPVP